MIKADNAPARSKNYFGTVINDDFGRREFEAVKKECREFNARERALAEQNGGMPLIKKVDAFARLGQDNPHATFYREQASRGASPYQRIRREHGSTLDIYVTLFQKVRFTKRFGGSEFGLKNVA